VSPQGEQGVPQGSPHGLPQPLSQSSQLQPVIASPKKASNMARNRTDLFIFSSPEKAT
jgi:hypothetical protein